MGKATAIAASRRNGEPNLRRGHDDLRLLGDDVVSGIIGSKSYLGIRRKEEDE